MKSVFITGVSSGIGKATAAEMGRLGFHVIAAGRSAERTNPVVDSIVSAGGSAEFIRLDLASFASIRTAASSYEGSGRSLDVLINNAGVGGVRGLTEEGFEAHFGVNHLGHFLLTHCLRRTLGEGSRIVVVSSEVHRRARGIDWARVQQKTRMTNSFEDYGVSKLANILFVRRLAELREDWQTFALHPGVVDTNIFPTLAKPFFRNRLTPEEGARTSVWCATSDEVSGHTGGYYSHEAPRDPSQVALDDQLARELWERSEGWCGVESACI